jgi:amino acid transporter
MPTGSTHGGDMANTAETQPSPSVDGRTSEIPRRMGIPSVVLTVLAYLSPLAGTVGFVPLVVGYGNGLGAPAMFLVAGGILTVFAVGFIAMVRQHPRPGAFYAYISAGLGKRIGLGAGFMTAAYYVLGGVGFYFFMGVSTQSLVETDLNINLPWWVYVAGFLAIVTFCSYRGMDFNVRIVGTIVCLEALVIMIFNLVTVFRGGPTGHPSEPFTWQAFTSGPMAVSALFAIALFAGFETTAIYREEVRDPDRTIPRASYILIATISIFYALTAWCLIAALGTDKAVTATANDPAGSFTTALVYSMGRGFSQFVGVLLVTSLLASQISIANASSRYLYSFGIDGILPKTVGVIHKRHGSPHRAAILNAALTTLFVLIFMISQTSPTVVYVVFNGVVIFAFEALMLLVSIAVLVYFQRNRGTGEHKGKVVIAPAVSAICFGWLIYFTARRADLLIGSPTPVTPILFALIGTTFVAGVLYASWLARRRPTDYLRIGRDAEPKQ